jgi:hypothetical protein
MGPKGILDTKTNSPTYHRSKNQLRLQPSRQRGYYVRTYGRKSSIENKSVVASLKGLGAKMK